MAYTGLEPGGFYWAQRKAAKSEPMTIVRVSTLFGEDREYWTVVLAGSEQHHMPGDFNILQRVDEPRVARQAAE